jgi:hypothetical protein
VAKYINELGFSGSVYAAPLAAKVQALLPVGAYVASINLVGEFIDPSGSVTRRMATDILSVVPDYARSISNRTTVFITNASAIHVSLYEKQLPLVS